MNASDIEGRSILVVDDEPVFARTLADGLVAELAGVEVHQAHNGEQALEFLTGVPIDLVVTDVKMPVMDGMTLVAEMVSRGINLPVIMMTAFGTRDIEINARRHGVISVVDKPIDFPMMVEICAGTLHARSRGSFQGITLAGFLQLLELEERSCTVQVFDKGVRGSITMYQGQVIRCSARSLDGFHALCEILSWGSPRIEMGPFSRPVGDSEPLSLNVALLEGARLYDEALRGQRSTGFQTPTLSAAHNEPPTLDPSQLDGMTDIGDIERAIRASMNIQGAIAVAIVDYDRGTCLGADSSSGFPIEVAATGNTEVIRAKIRVMDDLGIEGRINDVLITLDEQYHLLIPLSNGTLFLYMAMDRHKGNLAMARHQMMQIERELLCELGPSVVDFPRCSPASHW